MASEKSCRLQMVQVSVLRCSTFSKIKSRFMNCLVNWGVHATLAILLPEYAITRCWCHTIIVSCLIEMLHYHKSMLVIAQRANTTRPLRVLHGMPHYRMIRYDAPYHNKYTSNVLRVPYIHPGGCGASAGGAHAAGTFPKRWRRR